MTTTDSMATDLTVTGPVLNFAQATNQALDVALGLDETVFCLGEDISDPTGGGVFKCTAGLSTKYGDARVRHTPISEQAIMGAAVGSAIAGRRPVAEIMLMNFLSVCMDQLVNHAAKLRFMSGGQTHVPLTVRTATGAGAQFGAQHSDMLEAWLAHTAGLKVVIASTPADAKGLLLSAIFDDDPVVVIESTLLYFSGATGPVPEGDYRVPLGSARVARPGDEVTVVTYGRQVADALAVAEALAAEGISVEVIDLRSIVPLDEATVFASVARTRRAVVFHEAVRSFGVGAEVAARIHHECWGDLDAPVERLGGRSAPIPFNARLEAAYLPGQADLDGAIRRVLGKT